MKKYSIEDNNDILIMKVIEIEEMIGEMKAYMWWRRSYSERKYEERRMQLLWNENVYVIMKWYTMKSMKRNSLNKCDEEMRMKKAMIFEHILQ